MPKAANHQATNSLEMVQNAHVVNVCYLSTWSLLEHGSDAFNAFLGILGDKVPLKGMVGYRGGLDTVSTYIG